MKIKTEHLEYMRNVMQTKLNTLETGAVLAYMDKLAQNPDVKDVNKRFRWDLCYAAGLSSWICDNLYDYMNDVHIDTALKNIVNSLDYTQGV